MHKLLPVSVIIVSFNTKYLTEAALKALFGSSALPAEVIVVDNNSLDGSADMVAEKFPQVKLIKMKDNLGFAKANNLAIKQASQPFIWLLNSDTETGKRSLEQLLDFMESNGEVGALEPSLVYPNRQWQSVGGYFPNFWNVLGYLLPFGFILPKGWKKKARRIALYPQELPDGGVELDYATGAACFLRKAALDQAGLLGEDYFMYFEETDLCWRLKKVGWKIKAIPTDPVMHVYGGSFKTKRDPKRLNEFLRSLKIFVKKNYQPLKAWPIVALVDLLGGVSVWFKGQGRQA